MSMSRLGAMQQPAGEVERELPLHAMQAICQWLSVQDLQSLRLTCRIWKEAASTSISSISVKWQSRGSNACSTSSTMDPPICAVDPAVAQAVAAYPEFKQLRLQISPEVLEVITSTSITTNNNYVDSDEDRIDTSTLEQWWLVRSLLEVLTGAPAAATAANSSSFAHPASGRLQQLPQLLYVEALVPAGSPVLPVPPRFDPQHELLLQQALDAGDDNQALQLFLAAASAESQQQGVALAALFQLLRRVYLFSARIGSEQAITPASDAGEASLGSSSSSSNTSYSAASIEDLAAESIPTQPMQTVPSSQPFRLVLHTNCQSSIWQVDRRERGGDWSCLRGLGCLESLIFSGSSDGGSGSSGGMGSSLNCCHEEDALVGEDFYRLSASAGQLGCLVSGVTGYSKPLLGLGLLTNLQQLHLHGVAVDSRQFTYALNTLTDLRALHLSGDIWLSDLDELVTYWPQLTSLHLQQPLLPLQGQEQLPEQVQPRLLALLQDLPHLQQLGIMDPGTFRDQIQFTGESRTDELLLLQHSLHNIMVNNAAAVAAEGQEADDIDQEDLLDGVLMINEGLTMPVKDAARAIAAALSSSRMGNSNSSLLKQHFAGHSSCAASFLTALPRPELPSTAPATIRGAFSLESISFHMMSFVEFYHRRLCCNHLQQQHGADALTSEHHRLALLSVSSGQKCDLSKVLLDALPVSLEIETLPSLVQVLDAINWPLSLRPGFRAQRFDLQLLLPNVQPQLALMPVAGPAALAARLLRSLSIRTAATGGGLEIDGSLMTVITSGCPHLMRLHLEGQLVFLDGSGRSSSRNEIGANTVSLLDGSNATEAASTAAAGRGVLSAFAELEQLVLIDTRQQSLLQLHSLAALFAATPLLPPAPQQQQRWRWRLLKLSAAVVTGMATQMLDHHFINHRLRCMALTLVVAGLHMLWALKVENKHGEWFAIAGEQQELWQLCKRLRSLLWRRPAVHLCELPPNLKLLELSGVDLRQHGSSNGSCCCQVSSNSSRSSRNTAGSGADDTSQLLVGGSTGGDAKSGQQQCCCAAALQAVVLDKQQQQQQQGGSYGSRCWLTGSLHSSLGEFVHPGASTLQFFRPSSSSSSSSSSGGSAEWQQQCVAAARQLQLERWKCLGKLAGRVSVQLLKKLLLLQKQLHGVRLAGVLAGGLLVQLLLARRSGKVCRNSCCWELQVLDKGLGLLSSTSARAAALTVVAGKAYRKG